MHRARAGPGRHARTGQPEPAGRAALLEEPVTWLKANETGHPGEQRDVPAGSPRTNSCPARAPGVTPPAVTAHRDSSGASAAVPPAPRPAARRPPRSGRRRPGTDDAASAAHAARRSELVMRGAELLPEPLPVPAPRRGPHRAAVQVREVEVETRVPVLPPFAVLARQVGDVIDAGAKTGRAGDRAVPQDRQRAATSSQRAASWLAAMSSCRIPAASTAHQLRGPGHRGPRAGYCRVIGIGHRTPARTRGAGGGTDLDEEPVLAGPDQFGQRQVLAGPGLGPVPMEVQKHVSPGSCSSPR